MPTFHIADFEPQGGVVHLHGDARKDAERTITTNHYLRSVPSGKSHYLALDGALLVWSIPANKNISNFLLGGGGGFSVWDLSRLWAPPGHADNLLTRIISSSVNWVRAAENPDAVVSYADPNHDHLGGVYRAASWVYTGQSEETRVYRDNATSLTVSRRAFHSGGVNLTRAQIEAKGFTQEKLPGKLRFARPLTRRGKRAFRVKWEVV